MFESCSNISDLLQDLSVYFSRMARTMLTPRKEREERRVLWTKEVQAGLAAKGRSPPCRYTIHPQPRNPHLQDRRSGGWKRQKGRWRRPNSWRIGKVPIVIANLTVGPDGCGGQTICFRGGASQEEALPYCGRQSPPEGILQGQKG